MQAREFTVGTRQQREWGWLMIIDLFLAGTGAALFLIALILGFVLGMVVGGGLVIAGALFLLADLHGRRASWRLLSHPGSWVSRGTIGILSFAVLALVHILYLAIQPDGWTSLGAPWATGPAWLIVLGIISGLAALFVACYTGFLLGSMRSIPLGNSAYTPALFLVSALLGGLGVLYLLPLNWNNLPWSPAFLQNTGIVLVIFELFLLLSLAWLNHPETTGESIRLLTRGSLRFHFLIGMLGLGLIVPLVILVFASAGAATASLLPIAGVLLVIGMLLSRYTIVRAGIYASPV